jgi:hypothetical protein
MLFRATVAALAQGRWLARKAGWKQLKAGHEPDCFGAKAKQPSSNPQLHQIGVNCG